ncbi:MAG TPA: hypothetical protein VIO35_07910, partial [Chloroflexota bacterium]
LWNGRIWSNQRPMYVVEDPALNRMLSGQINAWLPPVALSTLGPLPARLGVQVIDLADFRVEGNTDADAEATGRLRPLFITAVRHLRDYLAGNDPELHAGLTAGWNAFLAAEIIVMPRLAIRVDLSPEESHTVPIEAHVSLESPRILLRVRSETAAGADEHAGRAIGVLFERGDREKLALAWSKSWSLATQGVEPIMLDLPEDQTTTAELEELARQVAGRGGARRIIRPADNAEEPRPEPGTEPIARRLKRPDMVEIASIEVVEGSNARVKSRKGKLKDPKSAVPPTTPASHLAPKTYDTDDAEEAAYRVFEAVWADETVEIEDWRRLRGLGSDAHDALGRFIELKHSTREMPDHVVLTANEAERATLATGNFYLVVVAGLEEGFQTTVKIIPRPLQNLAWQPTTSVSLGGIRHARGVHLRISEPT